MMLRNALFISFPFLLMLSSCNSLYYKGDIQQGNIIVQEQLDQLKLGMTKAAVIELLGHSLMPQESEKALEYIYVNYPGYGKPKKQRILLKFTDDTLNHFQVIN